MGKQTNFKVCSHNVTLVISDPSCWASDALGRADIGALVVKINEKCADDMQKSTFIHELLHIICDMYSLELTEKDIDPISVGFFSFIRNNPELVKWIMKNESDKKTR